jgi:hypothetical protein
MSDELMRERESKEEAPEVEEAKRVGALCEALQQPIHVALFSFSLQLRTDIGYSKILLLIRQQRKPFI